MIDIGLLHHLQKLARIGAQAFDIAPLPLSINRIKSERRFARSAKASDHRQRIARDINVNAFEIMFARAAHLNMSQHGAPVPHVFA